MKIAPLPDEDEKFTSHLGGKLSARDSTRADGWHVSGVIADLMRVGGLGEFKSGRITQPVDILRVYSGYIWEDMVGDYLSKQHVGENSPHTLTQLQVVRDGIHGTVDALVWGEGANGEVRIEEYKATWKGEERALSDGWRWWTQIKSYMACTGVRKAWLRVLYMCPTPRIRNYELGFSQGEIDECWAMVRQHKDYMEGKGKELK